MLDNQSAQAALRERHAELLADIDFVAERANAARNDPQPHATAILEGAEAALVRIGHEWRKSRGGNQNNLFFAPLSQRMRRIIAFYKKYADKTPKPSEDNEPAHWIYKITNFEALPFERLKPYFRASHVDDALKMGILLGLRELPGLLIWKEEKTDE
jgi:hypothetical protein